MHHLNSNDVVRVSLDNYYLPIEKQQKDQKGEVNFDLPGALDREQLMKDVRALMNGQTIQLEQYDFNVNRQKTVLTIHPGKIIIVEGLFVFHYQELRDLLNFGIFIDVKNEIQLERRMKRDMAERGYTKEAIAYQWENHVKPCFDKYLAPYRENAHFRFNNGAAFEPEFERLELALKNAMGNYDPFLS